MEKKISELKSLLSDELIIYKDVVLTAELINNAIKNKHIENLRKLTGQYDEFIGQIEELEEKRILICDSIMSTTSPKGNHLNLEKVITHLPEDKRKSLLKIRTSLKNELKKLTHINTANQILLSESLEVIDKNFIIYTQAQNSKNNYQQSGNFKTYAPKNNIVNHIA